MRHGSLLLSAVRYEVFCHEQASDLHRLPALNEQRATIVSARKRGRLGQVAMTPALPNRPHLAGLSIALLHSFEHVGIPDLDGTFCHLSLHQGCRRFPDLDLRLLVPDVLVNRSEHIV